jgi:hypothetical protein
MIGEAVKKHYYRQREVADHIGVYFTSISRNVNGNTYNCMNEDLAFWDGCTKIISNDKVPRRGNGTN